MDRPSTSLADADAADTLVDDALDDAVLAQSLVEEVSIDGMCGVY